MEGTAAWRFAPATGRRWPAMLLLPLAAFVVTGLTTTVLWSDSVDWALVVWQAFVLWPIGAALLVGPVAIVVSIHRRALRWLADMLVAGTGVFAMLLVAGSDDAQAGMGFVYAPLLGALAAGVVAVADRLQRSASVGRR